MCLLAEAQHRSWLQKAYQILPFQVGTIRLAAFNSRAVPDVAAAVRRLEGAGAAELVLDLRDNRGGLVQEGVELARLFLDGAHARSLSVRG